MPPKTKEPKRLLFEKTALRLSLAANKRRTNSDLYLYVERLSQKQTKIRRYIFFAAAGTTLITAAYLLKRKNEQETKEQEEAKEAEKQQERKR